MTSFLPLETVFRKEESFLHWRSNRRKKNLLVCQTTIMFEDEGGGLDFWWPNKLWKTDYLCVGARLWMTVTFLAPARAFCFRHKESQKGRCFSFFRPGHFTHTGVWKCQKRSMIKKGFILTVSMMRNEITFIDLWIKCMPFFLSTYVRE